MLEFLKSNEMKTLNDRVKKVGAELTSVKVRPRERPVIIRIRDHLDGFRMIRLAFYIRDSQEIDRRHVPPISEAIRGSGGID